MADKAGHCFLDQKMVAEMVTYLKEQGSGWESNSQASARKVPCQQHAAKAPREEIQTAPPKGTGVIFTLHQLQFPIQASTVSLIFNSHSEN